MTESSSDDRLKTVMRQEESCDVDIAYLELKLAVGDVHSSGKGLYGIWHRQVFSPSGGWEVVSRELQSMTVRYLDDFSSELEVRSDEEVGGAELRRVEHRVVVLPHVGDGCAETRE